jgi:hypothetical protein
MKRTKLEEARRRWGSACIVRGEVRDPAPSPQANPPKRPPVAPAPNVA